MSTAGDPAGHVFISYVREDRESVDRLQQVLEAAGIDVWRDTERLWPGQDWRVEIRRAITDGSLVFLACVSENSVGREKSYQNEELILAVEQMRLRPPGGEPWLIPVRFEECKLPEFDLGAGRTLDSLQRIDLFESWERGSARLVAAILRVLGATEGAAPDPAAVRGENLGRRLRRLIRDPRKDIELEELVAQTAATVRDQLQDLAEFPTYAEVLRENAAGARFVAEQATKYARVSTPVIELLVPGCLWGLEDHEMIWTRLMAEIANIEGRNADGGHQILLAMGRFPALVSLYAGGIASVHRERFGNLRAVAVDPLYRERNEAVPLIGALHPGDLFDGADVALNVLALEAEEEPLADEKLKQLISGRLGKRYTPLSDYLYAHLRPYFSELIVDAREYTDAFDEFEVLAGLIATDVREHSQSYVSGAWFGAFTWREKRKPFREQRLVDRLRADGDQAPEVQAGLFGGSGERAIEAGEKFVERAAAARHHQF